MQLDPTAPVRLALPALGLSLTLLTTTAPAVEGDGRPSPVAAVPSAEVPAAEAPLWRLALAHDREAHALALRDLAAWRRSGDGAAFRGRAAVLRAAAARRSAGLEADLAAAGLAVVGRSLASPAVFVRGDRAALDAVLAGRAEVTGLTADSRRAPALAEAVQAHGLKALHAQTLAGVPLEGDGVTVALLDSGLDLDMNGTGRPHRAFFPEGLTSLDGGGIGGSRILSSDWYGLFGVQNCPPEQSEDEVGHGTRVGSVLAGADWNLLAASTDGAAPGASLRSLKITDCGTFLASTFVMELALDAALLEPDVRVLNLSFDGTAAPGFSLNQAFDAAVASGVSVCLSAGNFGPAQDFMHGCFDALVVGASFQGSKAPYAFPGFIQSAVGPLPDGRTYPQLLAIGESLDTATLDAENTTTESFGTSGAAALVSGTAAILYQLVPTLDPLEVKALLLEHAAPLAGGDPAAGGYGFLDAGAAVAAAREGRYSSGQVAAGDEARWGFYAVAGEELSFTLVTTRGDGTSAVDLDLTLLAPDGTVLGSTAGARDNVEQLDAVAGQTGAHTLIARPSATFGVGPRRFALAGLGGAPAVVPDPTLGATAPQATAVSDVAAGTFYVKGSGLDTVTSAAVGGVPSGFVFEAPSRLRVLVPDGVAGPAVQVTLVGPGGVEVVFVDVEAEGADFAFQGPNFSSFVGWVLSGGEAGQPYWVVASPSATPTDLSGIATLAIGGGGTSLFLIDDGALSAFGSASGELQGLGGLPVGLSIFGQALLWDPQTALFRTSSVGTSLKVGFP